MSGKKLDSRTFKVVYEPDGTGWLVRIPEVKGCHSWGRSLGEARRHIREALSICDDVLGPEAERIARDATFDETMKVSSGTMAAVKAYTSVKEQAEAIQARAQEKQIRAAKALVKAEGVSLRDAGEFLGLSAERVRKLVGA